MRKSNTGENLNIITDRNAGRRSSLVLTDKYEEEDKSPDSTPSEKEVFEPVDPKLVEEVARKIRSIETDYRSLRLRKNKKKSKSEDDSIAPDEKEPDTYRSQFGDIQFLEAKTTIFDAQSFKESQFHGIYVMFWLSTGLLMFNKAVHAYLDDNETFLHGPVVTILRQDLLKIGLTDLAMYLGIYFAFFIQYLALKKVLDWTRSGWLIMAVYEVSYFVFWIVFASNYVMDYHWVGRIFLLLHSLVLLMKMHSYSFYNGYLWKIYEELEFSLKYLDQTTATNPRIPKGVDIEGTRETLHQSINFCRFELAYQAGHNTINSDPHLEPAGKAQEFPMNINLFNFFEYTMFPTMVYTLNFPRTTRIRRSYVFEKICGIFGVIFLMIIIAEQGFYPLVMQANELKSKSVASRATPSLLILLDMIPYFILEYILVFFLIWEFILNTIAELGRYADRDFYGPWWACTTFEEFARIWNRPVHKFLLRHVYHSSISAFKMNRYQAGFFTFVLSSIFHELAMYIIFNVSRGYLLMFQMAQVPLIMISNTKWMKRRRILGNVICWVGFTVGPSIILTLYLVY